MSVFSATRPAKNKSPYRRVPAAVGRGVLRKVGGEKGRKPYLTMVGIGAKSTSRSALLEHWGEQPISNPFRSQMAKVELRACLVKVKG